MKKLNKHILGIICLALVALMTLVASSIPSPNASALDIDTVVQEITINVYDKYAYVHPTNLNEGDVIIDPVFDIDFEYASATNIEFTLYKDGVEVGTYTYTPESYEEIGNFTYPVNLAKEYGDYVLTWHASGAAAPLDTEDSIYFTHAASRITYVGTDENGNPIYDIDFANDVESVVIQIYDENGNPIFNPALVYPSDTDRFNRIGDETPLSEYSTRARIVIPMPEGTPTGSYSAGTTAYGAGGELISKETRTKPFSYENNAPDVPDTGRFFGDLNLATTDYLITGLIIFFSAAIGALIIMNRRRNNSR